jgi:glycolate dehydrogenase FAD-binding subunit
MAAPTRPATADDAVDGVQPAVVVEPTTVEEASELLRTATAEGKRVICRGGGSKLGWGNPPSAVDLVVSTARLDKVQEHAEGDLIVRSEAGVRLDALQEVLGKAEQCLGLDPPEVGATLGGIVATAASGPLRHRYGTARDLLIGITVVLADGTIARSGGKVVKNVAGYDLGKLFTGSLGTLGLIAEVTFRLHPRINALTGATLEVGRPGRAVEAALALAHAQLVPAALELAWPDPSGPGRLLMLVEAMRSGVTEQARDAAKLLEPFGAAELIEPGAPHPRLEGFARRPWERGDAGTAMVGAKAACVPTELAGAIEDLWAAAAAHGLGVALESHAGVGVTYLALRGGDTDTLAAAFQDARERLARRGGTLVALEAPLELKRKVDVWGPVGDAEGLMRRVKERFDPGGTMSPGRFVGGI